MSNFKVEIGDTVVICSPGYPPYPYLDFKVENEDDLEKLELIKAKGLVIAKRKERQADDGEK
ncbi:hypothetical protein 035JT004_97 [Bacillus phage 035JT004]|nr:hypothetical protein 035JT004_97 [Bacillus phage 035JT004]